MSGAAAAFPVLPRSAAAADGRGDCPALPAGARRMRCATCQGKEAG
ncbi:hypothetical protein E5S69_28370 [Cupriavidus necator]|nr:hypothetical protein [Cupriavidus necator]